MTNKSRSITAFVFGLCSVLFLLFTTVNAQNKSSIMTTKLAKGTFEVKITPQPAEENVGDPTIGRLSMDKTFSGDIVGTSKGQMLGISTEANDAGGYVAAERVTGTLDGKKGGFALQHTGTMQGGNFEMLITVVPGSGTGELKGISGKMKIIIEKGKHFYEFEYSFAKPK
jgi:hypothetical protein